MKTKAKKTEQKSFVGGVGQALRRAATVARKTVRAHGTAVCVWRDCKVVAEKP